MGTKGYKVFNPDWTCKGFQYEVGKTYVHDGQIAICKEGFHFCKKASDCFNYYEFDSKNKVAEVEANGLVIADGNKYVTDKITIVREIDWHELLDLVNIGNHCTGLSNVGDYNTGNYNTGVCNIGDYNTNCGNIGSYNTGYRNAGNYNNGYYNTGNYNAGCYNAGNYNTGNYNIGHFNTGRYNIGLFNTGDYNAANYSTGFFNTVTQTMFAFNKPLENIDREAFNSCFGMQIIGSLLNTTQWIYSQDMTNEEKKMHPEHVTIGGYLKVVDYKTAWKIMWEKLTEKEKQAIKEIPNFDTEVFKEITGIDVNLIDEDSKKSK